MSQDQCADVISQLGPADEEASTGAKRSYMEENFQTNNPFYEAAVAAAAAAAESSSSLSRGESIQESSSIINNPDEAGYGGGGDGFASYARTGAVPKISSSSNSSSNSNNSNSGNNSNSNSGGGIGFVVGSSGQHVKMKKFKSAKEELSEAKETYSALLRMAAEPNRQNFNAFCEEKRDQLREVREESTKLLELRAIARQLHSDLPTEGDKTPDLIEAKMQSVFQKLERLNIGLEQLKIAHDMKFQD